MKKFALIITSIVCVTFSVLAIVFAPNSTSGKSLNYAKANLAETETCATTTSNTSSTTEEKYYTIKVSANAPERATETIDAIFEKNGWSYADGYYYKDNMSYKQNYTYNDSNYGFNTLPIYYINNYTVSYIDSDDDTAIDLTEDIPYYLYSNKVIDENRQTVLDMRSGISEGTNLIGWGLKDHTLTGSDNQRFLFEKIIGEDGKTYYSIYLINSSIPSLRYYLFNNETDTKIYCSTKTTVENRALFEIISASDERNDFYIKLKDKNLYFTLNDTKYSKNGVFKSEYEPYYTLSALDETLYNAQTVQFRDANLCQLEAYTSTINSGNKTYTMNYKNYKEIIFDLEWKATIYEGEAFDSIDYTVDNGVVKVNLSEEDFVLSYSLTEDGEYTTTMPDFDMPGIYTVYFKAESSIYETIYGSFEVDIPKFTYSSNDFENIKYTVVDGIVYIDFTNGDFTLSYSLTESGEYTTEFPVFHEKGTYIVYYKAESNKYETVFGTIEVVIEQAIYDGKVSQIIIDTRGRFIVCDFCVDSRFSPIYSLNEDGRYSSYFPCLRKFGRQTIYYQLVSEDFITIKGSFEIGEDFSNFNNFYNYQRRCGRNHQPIEKTTYEGSVDLIIILVTRYGIFVDFGLGFNYMSTFSYTENGRYRSCLPIQLGQSYVIYYHLDSFEYETISGSFNLKVNPMSKPNYGCGCRHNFYR